MNESSELINNEFEVNKTDETFCKEDETLRFMRQKFLDARKRWRGCNKYTSTKYCHCSDCKKSYSVFESMLIFTFL